jgi:hypothetical protein
VGGRRGWENAREEDVGTTDALVQPASEVQEEDRFGEGEGEVIARAETEVKERGIGDGLGQGAVRAAGCFVDEGDTVGFAGLAEVS